MQLKLEHILFVIIREILLYAIKNYEKFLKYCTMLMHMQMFILDNSLLFFYMSVVFSPEIIALLLDHILDEEKSETAIIGGIQVLLALLEVYPNRYVLHKLFSLFKTVC